MIRVLSGLPGSGKTTIAQAWVDEDPANRIRVNYDDIRVGLFGCKGPSYFTGKQRDISGKEATVKEEAHRRAWSWLTKNPIEHSVVIDNCNLTTSARAPWENLARQLGVPYQQDEIDTNIATCVYRDSQRKGDDRVGRAIIERMALFTGMIDWTKYKQPIVLVDIDGTLSDPTHRLHHLGRSGLPAGVNSTKPNWAAFHAEVDKDPPHKDIIELVHEISNAYEIIIVSGRSPEHGCAIKTEEWLDTHLNEVRGALQVPTHHYTHLFMRAAGDYRPDYEHKQQILDLLPKEKIAFVLDDRQQVVEMWRRNGLRCLQVAKGAF